jgi:hypothetical protein
MNAKQQIGAAAAGLLLLLGVAQAGSDSVQGSPAQPRAGTAGEVPEGVGATGSDVLVLEVGPMQGQASEDEIAAMQMLFLQLLMMQQEMSGNASEIAVPTSDPGVRI